MSQTRTVGIHNLFDYKRLTHPWDAIPVIVYFPFGLCLFLVRLFIGLHAFLAACLLPKTSPIRCFVLRAMCVVLGFVVKETDPRRPKGGCKVIVTNHVTNFDHLAVDLVVPCLVPGVWDLPKFLNWTLGFCDFGVNDGREALIDNVKKHLATEDAIPVLTHPEGATTNGRVGLLKFSSWSFSLDNTIHPIVITVTRSPLIKITPSVLGSRWWSDLFWILLTPWTTFSLRYLEPTKRLENESAEDFAKRVQVEMASSMGVVATNFSDADKVEYAKRLFHVPQAAVPSPSPPGGQQQAQRQTTTSHRVSPQLEQMAQRVKEVLPQVPLIVIKRDLAITANVDETITRILEGTVPYRPEVLNVPISQPNGSSSSSKTLLANCVQLTQTANFANSEMLSLNTAAKSFGKNASERISSYKDRKRALIEASRLRYIQKHGLHLQGVDVPTTGQ